MPSLRHLSVRLTRLTDSRPRCLMHAPVCFDELGAASLILPEPALSGLLTDEGPPLPLLCLWVPCLPTPAWPHMGQPSPAKFSIGTVDVPEGLEPGPGATWPVPPQEPTPSSPLQVGFWRSLTIAGSPDSCLLGRTAPRSRSLPRSGRDPGS